MKTYSYNKGFTLIETLVYLGLYSIIMTGALVSVYSIFSSSAHNEARSMVQEEGSFLIGKIDWAMSNAKIISAPASTGSTLTLTRYDGTVVTLSLTGTDLQIVDSGGAPQTLNNTNVKISSLTFTHVLPTSDGVNPESVGAVFTIATRSSDGLAFTRSFSTLKYLRK
jgi:type II secretory pathway pseudopilin PulG